jgi:ribose transport system substrate-binding protein
MMRVLGSTTKRRCTAVGLALAAAAALAACAPAPAAVSTGAAGQAADAVAATDARSGDILPFCPDQPTKVIFVKSAGGQVWSAIANAEFMAEAAKCKTIEATWYNGTTGQQGAIAATNAAVAQGNKVMVIIADFGTAQLASIRKATQAGVTVVPVVSDVGGQKGADYADQLLWDTTAIAENQARWLAANVKTGKVAFLGGQPGAPSTQKTFDAFKTAVTQLAPGIQLVPDTWVPTNWDAGQKRRAVAGLIAQNGDYAAFVSDYGASDIGAVQAVLDAGAPMPAFLNIGSSQGFVCAVHDHDIRWLGQDGSTRMTAAALRIALAEYEHKPSPEQNPYVLYTYADTVAGTTPACDPSISPDADLSSSLPADQLKALLGG